MKTIHVMMLPFGRYIGVVTGPDGRAICTTLKPTTDRNVAAREALRIQSLVTG
jgi:hypothetical protein